MKKQYYDRVVDYWKMSHNNFVIKLNAAGGFDSEEIDLKKFQYIRDLWV